MADLYPAELDGPANALIDAAIRLCKERLPKDDLSMFKIEEMIAVAAENSPVANPVLLALREAFDGVKAQFQAALADEKDQVRTCVYVCVCVCASYDMCTCICMCMCAHPEPYTSQSSPLTRLPIHPHPHPHPQVRRLGGLYVIGTERHESRRIDNQLRGRAGRQGDPGGTRFFLSLEDDIFRIFGGERMKGILDTFRVGEDLPIESKPVSDTLDKVQQQVESYYYDIRQKLLAFDNVISKQRKELYSIRAQIVAHSAEQLHSMMRDFARRTTDDIVEANYETEKRAKIVEKVRQFFPTLGAVDDAVRFDWIVSWVVGWFVACVVIKLIVHLPPYTHPPTHTGGAQDVQAADGRHDVRGGGPGAGQEAGRALGAQGGAVPGDRALPHARADRQPVGAAARGESVGRRRGLSVDDGARGSSPRFIYLSFLPPLTPQQALEQLKEISVLQRFKGADPMLEYEKRTSAFFRDLIGNVRRNTVYSLMQVRRVAWALLGYS